MLHGERAGQRRRALPDHARRRERRVGRRDPTRGRRRGAARPSAAREAERKALGAEVLHLYREINLIYSFSEKLAALLDSSASRELTLQRGAPPDRRHRRRR